MAKQAGVSNAFTATLGFVPPGNYVLKVNVTNLTTGQVIGTLTTTVKV
jgi:hypothetical protein